MCDIYNIGVTRKAVIIMSPVGRPKSNNPKSSRFSIRLDRETENKLKIYCDKHNITKGEAVRRGIHLLLSKEKE
jgi:hypothetical protein